jgi:hypothetical protein
MGRDEQFQILTSKVDHECPQAARWTVSPPPLGMTEPLVLRFDEALDPAMLQSALRVRRAGSSELLQGHVQVQPNGLKWSFHLSHAWQPGEYEIVIDPAIEDLAGNNLLKPFEVDLSQSTPPTLKAAPPVRFSVSER